MSQQDARPSQSMRLLAAASYPVWVFALVILFTNLTADPFMRRHGWTALYWWAALVIAYVGIFFIGLFPFLHWIWFLYPLVFPAFLILSVYYAILTYTGQEFSIPVVSEWAQKRTS
jgi:uncharacterized membrane protein